MNSSEAKDKILKEIELIPDARLAEIYDFIHFFRLGLETTRDSGTSLMRFAGSWQDMPDDVFDEFSREIAARRERAFSGRRSRETGTD